MAAGFFYLLEAFEWKTANPGQDYDDLETQMISPSKKTSRPNVAYAQTHYDPKLSSSDRGTAVSTPVSSPYHKEGLSHEQKGSPGAPEQL